MKRLLYVDLERIMLLIRDTMSKTCFKKSSNFQSTICGDSDIVSIFICMVMSGTQTVGRARGHHRSGDVRTIYGRPNPAPCRALPCRAVPCRAHPLSTLAAAPPQAGVDRGRSADLTSPQVMSMMNNRNEILT